MQGMNKSIHPALLLLIGVIAMVIGNAFQDSFVASLIGVFGIILVLSGIVGLITKAVKKPKKD